MRSRVMLVVGSTAVLAGVFAPRGTAPAESISAISSVQASAPEQRDDSVSVLTEVVTAQTFTSPRAAAAVRPASVRPRPSKIAKRSLLVRLLLGDGETRPEPFPRPGRNVSARP
jgi:hypothetical protein